MIIHVLVIESPEGNIEELKAISEREIASANIISWAEDHDIILDMESTESEIYFEEDEEGEYISRIIDENAGQAIIFHCELESYVN